jgi:hypothetical protein
VEARPGLSNCSILNHLRSLTVRSFATHFCGVPNLMSNPVLLTVAIELAAFARVSSAAKSPVCGNDGQLTDSSNSFGLGRATKIYVFDQPSQRKRSRRSRIVRNCPSVRQLSVAETRRKGGLTDSPDSPDSYHRKVSMHRRRHARQWHNCPSVRLSVCMFTNDILRERK